MTDVIEAEVVEQEEPRITEEPRAEIDLYVPEVAGTAALANLTEAEFDRRLSQLKAGRERIKRIQQTLLEKDVDYGLIPGTNSPTLYKPGAEKLCDFYRLAADFKPEMGHGDGDQTPLISVLMRCELHLSTLDGPVVGVGYGSANSHEKRYRYRKGERVCPSCLSAGTVIKGKEEYGGGWLCWQKRGGCGAKWPDGAEEIENQKVEDIQNPDPYDLELVLVKMAEKRAHVDATLRATATSGLFSQDTEEPSVQRLTETRAAPPARTERKRSGPAPSDYEEVRADQRSTDPDKCPDHGIKWRNGRYGWFCPGKTEAGTYCDRKPSEAWVAASER